jgi:hypothetical protein
MNVIMKISIILLLVITLEVLPQEFTSGYFVTPKNYMDEETRNQLGNKIKETLAGLNVKNTDDYFPVVTVVDYQEIETIQMPGIRKTYKTTGAVNLSIMFEHNNSILSAKSFNVEGTGNTIVIAQRNSIKNIKLPADQLKGLIGKASSSYSDAIEEYGKTKVKEAEDYFSKGKFYYAIEVATEVPKDSKSYKKAQNLIAQSNHKIKEIKDEMARLAEQKRAEKILTDAAERRLKIETELAQQDAEIKKMRINKRTKVEEGFSKLWSSIFGS